MLLNARPRPRSATSTHRGERPSWQMSGHSNKLHCVPDFLRNSDHLLNSLTPHQQEAQIDGISDHPLVELKVQIRYVSNCNLFLASDMVESKFAQFFFSFFLFLLGFAQFLHDLVVASNVTLRDKSAVAASGTAPWTPRLGSSSVGLTQTRRAPSLRKGSSGVGSEEPRSPEFRVPRVGGHVLW